MVAFYDFYGFKDRPTNDVDEFETLLFSQPEYYTDYFGDNSITQKMNEIIQTFQDDIEKINDSPETAPSKRLEELFEKVGEYYDKVFHGEGIASDIGIEVMRKRAKRFNCWVEKIIVLSS